MQTIAGTTGTQLRLTGAGATPTLQTFLQTLLQNLQNQTGDTQSVGLLVNATA